MDLDPPVEIPALANFVCQTNRGTTIAKEGVEVKTPEHLLAALSGAQVSNCYIELSGAEIPILDGSAIEFLKGIHKAGIQAQEALQERFVVQEIIRKC